MNAGELHTHLIDVITSMEKTIRHEVFLFIKENPGYVAGIMLSDEKESTFTDYCADALHDLNAAKETLQNSFDKFYPKKTV